MDNSRDISTSLKQSSVLSTSDFVLAKEDDAVESRHRSSFLAKDDHFVLSSEDANVQLSGHDNDNNTCEPESATRGVARLSSTQEGVRETFRLDEEMEETDVEKETQQLLRPGDEGFDETNAHIGFVLDAWAQDATVHGVNQISDSARWQAWKRMLWFLLVCSSGSIMVWQIEALVQEYRHYDVVTDTATVIPSHMAFPEITLCNENSLSRIRKEYLGIQEPRNESELTLLSQPLHFDHWTNIPGFISKSSFNAGDDLVSEASLNQTWSPHITVHGRCWTFSTNETVLRPGFYGGLWVELFLNQFDYDIDGTGVAGVLVFAQQPGTDINYQIPYVAASPGKASFVSIRMTEFELERHEPWARCHSEAPGYTQSSCRVDCLNAAIRKSCGCRWWGDHRQREELSFCTRKDDACTFGLLTAEEETILAACSCDKPPCHSLRYEMQLTEQQLSNTRLESLRNASDVSEKFLLDNWVGIQINFAEIQYDVVTETKDVTFAQLLGSIGGSMGLFLGISALSIFDVFGDLAGTRLVPRLFGNRHLYGLGARKS